MYKAIVTDLDETLLTTDKKISKRNEEALRMARDKGCAIVLCSGRSQSRMKSFVDFLGFRNPGEYYMSVHGGVIIDAFTDEPVETHYIDKDKLRWFITMGRQYKDFINVHLYKDADFFIERRDASTDMYERLTELHKAIEVPDLLDFIDDTIIKALFISQKPGLIFELKPELEKTMPSGMRLVASSPYLLEYSDNTINKGTAVRHLMERMQIPLEMVICVGDSYNDISMIETAGLGIAVRNAEQQVKAAADYVTTATNNEDALAEIVEKFVMGE